MQRTSEPEVQLLSISKLVSHMPEGPTVLKQKKAKHFNGCCNQGFLQKRFVFALIGFLACSVSWSSMTNFNFAIVYMVDRSNVTAINVKSSNECLANIPSGNVTVENETQPTGEFYWSPEMEGITLAALFYGTLLGSAPGGRLSELYGGKHVVVISLLLSSILTCLTVEAARFSVYALIACRFLLGITSAPIFPALYYLMTRWTPKTELSLTSSIVFAGCGIGSFSSFLLGGVLCASNFLGGWPAVFYLLGMYGIFVSFLCHIFVYETPEEHPSITTKELDFISMNIGPTKRKRIENVPWKSMLFSVPLWSLMIGCVGKSWITSITFIAQSIYMGTILNLDSVQNGILSSLAQIISILLTCVLSYPLDWAQKRKYISEKFIRYGVTILNSVCCVTGIVGILFAGCDPMLNTIYFTLAGCAENLANLGESLNILDIAPNLSGTLHGIRSFVATTTQCMLPALIGWMTKYERSMAQWRFVYYWSIVIVVVTAIIFVCFGSTEPQPWGSDNKTESGNQDETKF